ncbi:MAG: hypothetical protein HFE83_02310 [Lachnospiraceae bacterium]|jgi:hypothetical protein|nr:hypothetical protein [Lachnospiraceae bacterium]
MAKDDYFVIVYRILSYLYECFKQGEKPDTDLFGSDALRINNGYWVNVMESLLAEGYIKGIAVLPYMAGRVGIKILDLKITQKGIEFLQDNSKMAKAKEFLKTVKETIPGL